MTTRLVPEYIERLVPYQPGKPVDELERELGITGAIKLASNENPRGPSPKALDAVRAHIAESHRYPDAAAFRLRSAIAKHHDVPMDDIVVTNGSNELIDLLVRTFCSPADHVVFGNPSFVCYRLSAIACNVPFAEVPLRDHLSWDLDAMLAAVKPNTKLLFLTNPNNPTGAYVGAAQLREFLARVPEHVIVAMDEAYVEFPDASDYESALSMRGIRDRLIVMRTFSKAYGLAAMRVGYGIATRAMVDFLNRVRAPFNVNTLGQIAAIAALDDREHVESYLRINREERARLTAAFSKLGLTVAPSQANFVLINVERPGKEVYDAMLRKGLIVRPMPPPIDRWLRITVGMPNENDRLIAAAEEIFR